jgi:alkylation response protein AidB-like acyl-CoA dehydrogenase
MTGFADLHDDLRAVARNILTPTSPLGTGAAPPSPVDYHQLAAAGWLGLEVPENMEGAGATFAETAVVLREMGRAAASVPFLGPAVLGVGVLNLVQATAPRDEMLRRVASGQLRVAVVLPTSDEPFMSLRPVAIPFTRTPDSLLHGQAAFIPDAGEADRLLVITAGPDPDAGAAGGVAVINPNQPGVEFVDQPVLDATRHFAAVAAAGPGISVESEWSFAGDAVMATRRVLDRGALAVACDSLGLAEAALEATVAYAGSRQQFGRPIGSFQAVKHACADMLVRISVGRQLVEAAVDAIASDDPDGWVAVSRAKSYSGEAAVDVVGKAMQLHGGIGYTWESGIHVYLKRAVFNRSLFGSPTAHRRRLAARFR